MQLTGVDQLWVADITYIRLHAEFVYLAVLLDGFSRKVVGSKLDHTLTGRLATEALEQAIAARQPLPGLVHHSDRGVQYAAGEYVAILRKQEMVSSMSRPANPYDNASCESFIKTLKREEIYANEYENLEHLRDNIEEFIERYYNQKRLHSALGYCSPEEFEQQAPRESDIFPWITRRIFYKRVGGRGSYAVPSPGPIPAWRINEMTLRTEQCGKLSQAGSFQMKGSTKRRPRSVATKTVSMKGFTPSVCG